MLPEWVEELQKQESKCFYRVESDHQEFFDLGAREYQVLSEDPEKIQLTLLKKQDKVIRSNAGASLIDLGDGVACLEFHSKMNVIGGDVVALARWAVDEVEKDWVGLVIGNQGENFSVGANLMLSSAGGPGGKPGGDRPNGPGFSADDAVFSIFGQAGGGCSFPAGVWRGG